MTILKWFAGHQIRNVATFAGNIATASPISDLNPIFMSLVRSLRVNMVDYSLDKQINVLNLRVQPFG